MSPPTLRLVIHTPCSSGYFTATARSIPRIMIFVIEDMTENISIEKPMMCFCGPMNAFLITNSVHLTVRCHTATNISATHRLRRIRSNGFLFFMWQIITISARFRMTARKHTAAFVGLKGRSRRWVWGMPFG